MSHLPNYPVDSQLDAQPSLAGTRISTTTHIFGTDVAPMVGKIPSVNTISYATSRSNFDATSSSSESLIVNQTALATFVPADSVPGTERTAKLIGATEPALTANSSQASPMSAALKPTARHALPNTGLIRKPIEATTIEVAEMNSRKDARFSIETTAGSLRDIISASPQTPLRGSRNSFSVSSAISSTTRIVPEIRCRGEAIAQSITRYLRVRREQVKFNEAGLWELSDVGNMIWELYGFALEQGRTQLRSSRVSYGLYHSLTMASPYPL
ncbi:MAG: hypothetical protein Q9227_000006 [Pyrenula ochraceoflavens]